MSKHDPRLRGPAAETRPECDTREFDLPRLGAVVSLYAVYVVAVSLLVGPALDGLDAAFPSAFFYHLQAGEADGPIGDPMRLATGIWVQLLAFWLTFAPVALRLRTPASALVALTVLNEPLVLAIIPGLLLWAAGLAAVR